jgi:hypothetical protein
MDNGTSLRIKLAYLIMRLLEPHKDALPEKYREQYEKNKEFLSNERK